MRPLCPFLPPLPPARLDYRYLREAGPGGSEEFYRRALIYGHYLWERGHSARAILALTRGLYTELREPPPWPLPFAAIAWIVRHHPSGDFLGNPRISFQHQADRVRGPRAPQKAARAWAVWALVRQVRPDLPGDPRHVVDEPGYAAIRQRLEHFGLEGEGETWEEAMNLSASWR